MIRLDPNLFAGILPFVRVAEERSFGRAAASLGVTTAAMSKAVRRLEEELGVRLLDRSSRVVVPTREGELFLERCRRAVLDVQGARDVVQGTRREPQGELAVTLPFILAPFVVPHLARLGAQYPRLAFRIQLSDRMARLADENYDVAIRMGELEPSSLVTRLLRRTRWVTVGAPSYLARRPPPRSIAELTTHNCLRFVAPNGRMPPWQFLDPQGRPVSVVVAGNLVIDQGVSLLDAAEAGMGLAQVPDFMVQDTLRAGRLTEVLASVAAAGPEIHALTTSGRSRSANVRAFMAFLVDAFRT
jgi:LysR family transcriptional regulator, regulator for bpeEF and oprC